MAKNGCQGRQPDTTAVPPKADNPGADSARQPRRHLFTQPARRAAATPAPVFALRQVEPASCVPVLSGRGLIIALLPQSPSRPALSYWRTVYVGLT